MGKYFGTDGVRGIANENLTVELAYKVGRYLAYYYGKVAPCQVVIGKDTRLSSSMFEAALISGFLESGAQVYQLGYTSTPCVSHLVANGEFNCGVMISASHNPYYDNGIKVFKSDGTKIDSELEDLIEEYFGGTEQLQRAARDKIGKLIDFREGILQYQEYLVALVEDKLDNNLKIAVDLANGSSCYTAPVVFEKLGLNVDLYFDKPDGININNDCGSTHLSQLQKLLKEKKYDLAFAFDGDADRMLALDEDGKVVDGDAILYICGTYLKAMGQLTGNTVVTTVMSNIGFHKAMKSEDIKLEITQVGDKYVYDCMKNGNYALGGEQSGHIIFSQYANSGDGLLTALVLLQIISKSGSSLKELLNDLVIYPQLLVNLKVRDKNIINDPEVVALIGRISADLGDEGRILVRTSGTEPLIRVMVEAKNDDICRDYVDETIALLKQKDLLE